jgi:hypothetical protein
VGTAEKRLMASPATHATRLARYKSSPYITHYKAGLLLPQANRMTANEYSHSKHWMDVGRNRISHDGNWHLVINQNITKLLDMLGPTHSPMVICKQGLSINNERKRPSISSFFFFQA